jgi:8-oxo-dGTP pyrophosphatase MutT (NUDIX family)
VVKGKTEKEIVREFSAGGVVYKLQDGNTLFLITKSNPSKVYPDQIWRLPKGWLDDEDDEPGPKASGRIKASEEDLQSSALREVAEEGGVEAEVIEKIKTDKLFFVWQGKNILKFVTFYLMKWKRDIPQGYGFETSEVAWLELNKARKMLKYSSEKKVLDEAVRLLGPRN